VSPDNDQGQKSDCHLTDFLSQIPENRDTDSYDNQSALLSPKGKKSETDATINVHCSQSEVFMSSDEEAPSAKKPNNAKKK